MIKIISSRSSSSWAWPQFLLQWTRIRWACCPPNIEQKLLFQGIPATLLIRLILSGFHLNYHVTFLLLHDMQLPTNLMQFQSVTQCANSLNLATIITVQFSRKGIWDVLAFTGQDVAKVLGERLTWHPEFNCPLSHVLGELSLSLEMLIRWSQLPGIQFTLNSGRETGAHDLRTCHRCT